jgi:hypothetical protein
MSGLAQVVLDGEQRHWEFQPQQLVWREDALPLRWALLAK